MQYISKYIKFLEARNLSPNTVSVYSRNLMEFQQYLAERNMSVKRATRDCITQFLCFIKEKNNQPITRRLKQTTLRNFYLYLENEKIIASSPTKNIPLPKVMSKEPNHLTEQEIVKLLQAVQKDKSIYGKRNEIIVRTLAETGIRLSELTGLDIGNIQTKEKTIKVIRKGNIEQTLPINMKLNILLKAFIGNKGGNEPLLVSNHKKRITNRRVGLMIQQYLKKANIEKPNISCHSIRHSFCVRLLEQGVDIKTIQVLAGHKSIETTSGYLHIAKTRLRKEVAKVEI